MSSPALPRLMILAAAVLFSTGGAAIKACQLSAWQVATFRSAFACVAILALIPEARRLPTRKTLAVSIFYAATMILFTLGNKLTTSANTIFLQSTAPLYILLLAPLLLRERIGRRDMLFMVAVASGLGMFFLGSQPSQESAPQPFQGNIVGLFCGLAWALTVTGLRWIGRAGQRAGATAIAAVAWGNLLTCLVGLPFSLPVAGSGITDWLLLVYLGVLQIGLAYLFLTRGLRTVPAFESSLLLLLEPVLNPIWAWIFLREKVGPWPLVGGVIILASTAVKIALDYRASRSTSL